MSKPTTTKTKKKTTNESNQDLILSDLLDSLLASRQATRELAESVDAWKVTTLVFSITSIIALITSLLK
jgi:hypothetical protein